MNSRYGSKRLLRVFLLCFLLSCMAVLTAPQLTQAMVPTTIYVNAAAGGANDGTSWEAAYTDLQSALGAAVSGDQIWVAAGTYTPGASGSRTAAFQMKNDVAIYGGFAGNETELSQRNPDPATNGTILTGDLNANGRDDNDAYHVVTADSTVTSIAVIDGFTITGGNGNASNTSFGGGIYIVGAAGSGTSVDIKNAILSGNAAYSGGGMYLDNATATLTNVKFLSNSALSGGGGLYTGSSSPTVTVINALFVGNTAGTGGGLSISSGSATITNSLLTGNTATGTTGGILTYSASVTIGNSIVWGNTGPNPNIYIVSGSVTITHSDFNSITAPGGYTDTENIHSDPLLVNAAGGYYYLKPGSPCINAGSDALVSEGVTTDLAGNSRFVGTVDMGPYEYYVPDHIYVKADAVGANTGTSWADAYTDLQSALSVAVAGKQIWVAPGTYYPGSSGTRTAAFPLKNGVAIYGGCASTETDLSGRNPDPATNGTVLSGDLDGSGTINANDAYHVVTADSTVTAGTILDGFTITGGNANGDFFSTQDDVGGGMNCTGNPTLNNLRFDSNFAGSAFGANGGGGGIHIDGSPTLNDVSFSNNTAGGDGRGGGMWILRGSVTLNRVDFNGNTAHAEDYTSNAGGGMLVNSFGTATAPVTVTMNGGAFTNNHADWGGGLSWNETSAGSSATLKNVQFLTNSAIYGGGGIYNSGLDLTIANALFTGNDASDWDGGAIDSESAGNVTVTNATFTQNSSAYSGGAIEYYDSGTLNVTNCIFWGNTATDTTSRDIDNRSSVAIHISYSDFDPVYSYGISAGSGNINATPLFVNASDFHLRSGSPAIDAGNNSAVPSDVTADLDGSARFFDDPATANTGSGTPPIVDMGPYEYQGTVVAFTVTYNGNGNTGGTAPVDGNSPYYSGSTVTVLGAGSLVRTGYTFAGWNTAADGTGTDYSEAATFTIFDNTTMYAQWTPLPTYTVTYSGNGNTGGTAPVDGSSPYYSGSTVTVLGAGDLVKTNSTFAGWNTLANGSGTSYSANQTFTMGSGNVILYAQWTPNTQQAPVVTTQPGNQDVQAGQTATFSAAATGLPAPTVQWQVLPVGGRWANIRGATLNTYSFTAQATDNGKQFRAIFTNIAGTATTATALLTITGVDVAISDTGSSYDSVTNTINWRLSVVNNGAIAAQGVVVTDNLANGTKASAVTLGGGSSSSYKVRGRTVTINIPTLAPGGTAAVSIVIQAAVGKLTGTIINTATVTTASPDPDLSNNTAIASVSVNGPPSP